MKRFVLLTVLSTVAAVVVSAWTAQHRTGAFLKALRRRGMAGQEPAEIALPQPEAAEPAPIAG